MQDVDIIITGDDSSARTAIERTNSMLDRMEKQASRAAETIARGFDNATRILGRLAEAAGLAYAAKKAWDGLTTATLENGSAADRLVNGYRALRLALSPTIFTGVTVGLGILAEESVRAAYAEGVLIEKHAAMAATMQLTVPQLEEMRGASRILGADFNDLAQGVAKVQEQLATHKGRDAIADLDVTITDAFGRTKQANIVFAELAREIDAFYDPVDKAKGAIDVFGAELGLKLLPYLKESTARYQESARESMVWSNDTRKAITLLKTDLDDLKSILPGIGSEFNAFWEKIRAGAVATAAVVNAIRPRDLPTREQELDPFGIRAKPVAAEDLNAVMGAGWRSAQRMAPGHFMQGTGGQGMALFLAQVGNQAGSQQASDAALKRFAGSIAGINRELADMATKRDGYLDLLDRISSGKARASVEQTQALGAAVRNLNAAIKDSEGRRELLQIAEKLGTLTISSDKIFEANRRLQRPRSLYREGEPTGQERYLNPATGEWEPVAIRGTYQLPAGWDAGQGEGAKGAARAALEGAFENDRIRRDREERSRERELRHRERMIELTAGPGGELDAVQQIYDLRVQSARTVENLEEARVQREERVVEIWRQRFDSLKHSAEGIFDALLSRSSSVFSAIGNTFKMAILTPIKEAFSTWIAGMMLPVMYGGRGTVGAPAGGGMMSLGGLLGIGGFGAGGGTFPGGLGPGGTAPFNPNAPIFTGAGGSANPLAGLWQGGGWGGAGGAGAAAAQLGGLAALLGGGMLGLSGLQRGGALGNAMTVGGGSLLGMQFSQMLGMTSYGGAIFGAGAGLAAAGLQRGGWSGLGMSTAGGALVGMQFGGPVGAAIGAGAGFAAGLVRMLFGGKSKEEQIIEKVRSAYKMEIDKPMATQIWQIAKAAFGGNIDIAVYSSQVRELLGLYSMNRATGGTFPATQRALSLTQFGGSVYQAPDYQNGALLSPLSGSIPSFDSLSTGVRAQNAGPTIVNLTMDSKTIGTLIVQDGRVVTDGLIRAQTSSYGRREMQSVQGGKQFIAG